MRKTKQTIAKKMKMKRYVRILRLLMKVQNHLRDAFKEERIQGVNLCKERYKMIGN